MCGVEAGEFVLFEWTCKSTCRLADPKRREHAERLSPMMIQGLHVFSLGFV